MQASDWLWDDSLQLQQWDMSMAHFPLELTGCSATQEGALPS